MKYTKWWVRYYSPGSFMADNWVVEHKSKPDPKKVERPDRAYAFTIHKREDIKEGRKNYSGESKQVGLMYYHPDSKIETAPQVKVNPNATTILARNMACNGWEKIIWSRWGNWPQPFDDKKARIL